MKNSINQIIEPRTKDIGITVRRILPWAKKRTVGPFIFLDHMGPAHFHPPYDHMDVSPHPHIGLSTLTYLLEGEILHRDSLGVVQKILPGEVNWMTAGKGISHSERETDEARKLERTIHGLQFWVALPKEKEDMDPTFHHYDGNQIPKVESEDSLVDIVAGTTFGKTSPLIAHSPMKFIVVKAKRNAKITIPSDGHELAIYIVKGSVTLEETYHETQMIVLNEGSDIELTHSEDAVFAVLGGEPLPEKRFIWWNLVSSSEEKIEAAKKAWREGTFPGVPGDDDRIPLPPDTPKKIPSGQVL